MNTKWSKHVMPDVHTLKDKCVLIRVDWNMPVVNGTITDTSRFDVTVPLLKELSFAGVKMVILTHFGEKGESLGVIAKHVTAILPFISFASSLDFDELQNKVQSIDAGTGILLENVRMWKGETDNIPSLGRSFASLGDIFINNAFSVSHREHASVVGIPKNILSYFGPTFIRELEHLTELLTPKKPALLIIGGSKISTKLPLIERYLDQGIQVFVGGALAHNIWKAKGIEIGNSLYELTYVLSETFINHPLLMTPEDVVLVNGTTVPLFEIPSNAVIVDCGVETIKAVGEKITNAKTVIVNGPLGLYEKGWLHGSEQILTKLANTNTTSYIGGGDTVEIAHSLHLLKKFTFVSLGGGAMLDFLSSGTLPGIDAVTK
jgi:phosphoglycerate kinase